jgi:hypothetical protein
MSFKIEFEYMRQKRINFTNDTKIFLVSKGTQMSSYKRFNSTRKLKEIVLLVENKTIFVFLLSFFNTNNYLFYELGYYFLIFLFF